MAKRSLQRSLTDFLVKKTKPSTEEAASCSQTADSILHTEFQIETGQITPITEDNIHEVDIGCCFDQKLNDDLKYKLLTNVWAQPPLEGNGVGSR